MAWHPKARPGRAPWFRPATQARPGYRAPAPEHREAWHPGDPTPPPGPSGFPAWHDFTTRYSEDEYLAMPGAGGLIGGGAAVGAMVGVGNVFFVVMKMARRLRDPAGSRYIFSTGSTDTGDGGGRGMRVNTPAVPGTLGGDVEASIYRAGAGGIGPAGAQVDAGWGPHVIALGSPDSAGGDWAYLESNAHVAIRSSSGSTTAIANQIDLFMGRRPDTLSGNPDAVSISVLTVEPTPSELDSFSRKGVMVQDVWSADDVWNHYHVGSLRDAGASWVLDPWPDQAGPMVEMVLGSAVSDANLTAWTEPTREWPLQPSAMMTGDYIAGAGIRWLESQAGRVFGTVTGRGLLMKCTRDADGPGSSRHYSDAYETGATRTGFLRDAGGTFPAATILGDGQATKGPTYSTSVAGDIRADTIDMIGTDCDSAGAYNVYAAGVKVSAAVAAVAVVPAERITAGARADTATVGTDIANTLIQEVVYANRPLVGDEWLTLSSNLGVDPRLVLGMAGIDTDGALQHVYSLAYIDIATQKVPDLIDGAAAADSLDVQGTAVTAGQIIPINASGEPVFGSFGDGFDESFS